MEWEIQNATIIGVDEISEGNILISEGKIQSVGTHPNQKSSQATNQSPILSAESLFVYPALINAHDHLIGSYSPAVLNQSPYLSWLTWDNILKSSLVFSERQTLDLGDLYQLGSYKNLFGGTTTVMDHVPHFLGSAYREDSPIRILKDYCLSHSIGTYSLDWGEGPTFEYADAVKKNIPYVTHIGEGWDEESQDSLRLLEKWNALGEHSVLVHGIPYGAKEIQKLKSSRANMVWCPSSNANLFGKIPPIAGFLGAGIPVSLGTDLALTGSGNLLFELRQARKLYQENFSEDISPKTLFEMVTANPAKALRIDKNLGSIQKGKYADLLVLPKKHEDPYENLLQSEPVDIVLLTKEGVPILADGKLEGLVADLGQKLESISLSSSQDSEKREKLVMGSPKNLLKKIQLSLGYKKDLAFLPIIE